MTAKKLKSLRVAMPAWEIGRVSSGLGAKVGGLGVIVEELPPELVAAAARRGVELEVEVLSPCFAHYDRTLLTRLDLTVPVTLEGHAFDFEVYEHVFPDGIKGVYFWDAWQLGWTGPSDIYPDDPQMGLKLYSAVAQAMAGYIRQRDFQTVHLHDYHVGLVPFFLGGDLLAGLPVHLTIHNATYQGTAQLMGGGYSSLDRLGLPGEQLFHRYFDFFDQLNLMKACMLKVHEGGGRVTTVSGDLEGTWGYAAELRATHADLVQKATAEKGSPPGEVFVPNRHLDLLEKIPVAGITNGMGARNRADRLPELQARILRQEQNRRGPGDPIFIHPLVQERMLAEDHTFDVDHLEVKAELKGLLHMEAFGAEPHDDPILLTAVGRLVEQKNLGLVADVAEHALATDPGVKLIVLASAPDGDAGGKATEGAFHHLAAAYPGRIYFNKTFNLPLSKLILAGGDFCLIPSRFEPCGLVDYEASLLGNVVVARRTGGLSKIAHCGYLYDWQDVSDRAGEAWAFMSRINEAVQTYRAHPERHGHLMREAIKIDASWDRSADEYVQLYLYGLLVKRWHAAGRAHPSDFVDELGKDRDLFHRFFAPGHQEYADSRDWQLKQRLKAWLPGQGRQPGPG